MVLVREFLRAELDKQSKSAIEFYVTGPSPFHVDFALVDAIPALDDRPESSIELLDFTAIRHRYPGYDDVLFAPAPGHDMETQELHQFLLSSLADELALYYALVREGLERLDESHGLLAKSQELVAHYQKPGFGRRVARIFKSGADARDLLLDVISAEARSATAVTAGSEAIRDLSDRGSPLLFEPEIKTQASQTFGVELKAARDIATALEGSRKKSFEVAVLSSATLLGAAAGAIASVVVR